MSVSIDNHNDDREHDHEHDHDRESEPATHPRSWHHEDACAECRSAASVSDRMNHSDRMNQSICLHDGWAGNPRWSAGANGGGGPPWPPLWSGGYWPDPHHNTHGTDDNSHERESLQHDKTVAELTARAQATDEARKQAVEAFKAQVRDEEDRRKREVEAKVLEMNQVEAARRAAEEKAVFQSQKEQAARIQEQKDATEKAIFKAKKEQDERIQEQKDAAEKAVFKAKKEEAEKKAEIEAKRKAWEVEMQKKLDEENAKKKAWEVERQRKEDEEKAKKKAWEVEQARKKDEEEEAKKAWEIEKKKKEMKEKEKQDKAKKDAKDQERSHLLAAGLPPQQVEAIINPESAPRIFAGTVPSVQYSQYSYPDTAYAGTEPTYIRVRREHLAIETLTHYSIPWRHDPHDSAYIIILRDINDPGIDLEILFDHTRRLRCQKPWPFSHRHHDKIYLMRRKSKGDRWL